MMLSHRSTRIPSVLLGLLALAAAGAATGVEDAGPMTGRQVMDLVDARDDGDHATQDMKMILIDKNGSQRKRTEAKIAKPSTTRRDARLLRARLDATRPGSGWGVSVRGL